MDFEVTKEIAEEMTKKYSITTLREACLEHKLSFTKSDSKVNLCMKLVDNGTYKNLKDRILDDEQKKFINDMTSAKIIVTGPPGSGKTTILIEKILKLKNQLTLILGQTNSTCGILIDRLKAMNIKVSENLNANNSTNVKTIDSILYKIKPVKDISTLHEEVLKKVIENELALKCDWVFIDEAQDISDIQWEILRRLLCRAKHIVLMGDTDQTITRSIGGFFHEKCSDENWTHYNLKSQYRYNESTFVRNGKKSTLIEDLLETRYSTAIIYPNDYDPTELHEELCRHNIQHYIKNKENNYIPDNPTITLGTSRYVKGCEFEFVALIGFNDNSTRDYYVASTRGKTIVQEYVFEKRDGDNLFPYSSKEHIDGKEMKEFSSKVNNWYKYEKIQINGKRVLILDVETTGLNHDVNKLLEIGAICLQDSSIQYSSLINPEINFISYSGITMDDVVDAPYYDDVIRDFKRFIVENNIDSIAWFAITDFDLRWFPSDFFDGLNLINIRTIALNWIKLNNLRPSKKHIGNVESLYEYIFKQKQARAHRALTDAIHEAAILRVVSC
jgi:DNA polymerase III epsilon subunit-like protein/thymidine kinase